MVFWENVEGVRLISKYVLDCQPYNDSKDVIWENSTLHNWLNNEFYNEAFNVPWIVLSFIDKGGVNVNRLLIYKNNMKTLYFLNVNQVNNHILYNDNVISIILTNGNGNNDNGIFYIW